MYTPDKLLSIIIPTYNMEQYLRYCLDSLLIRENFEALDVLIINDGSKDTSSAIAHEYADKYPKVFRVIDKENGNYGSCINRGLKEATGKYIKVLDADDSFNTQNLDNYVAYLANIDADLIISDVVIVNEKREKSETISYRYKQNEEMSMCDICSSSTFASISMHAITYRLENLRLMGYHQSEGISYTDQEWIFSPMTTIKKVYSYNTHIYEYLIGREGQTMDPHIKAKHMSDIMQCIYKLIASYTQYENIVTTELLTYMQTKLLYLIKEQYVSSFCTYNKHVKENLICFDNKIKELNTNIYFLIEKTKSKFNYIRYWRNHPHINIHLVRITSSFYIRFIR